MAIDVAWVGVVGTAVGGLLGVGGTLLAQRNDAAERCEARREDRNNDDRLRYIDQRREIYGEWESSARSANKALVEAARLGYVSGERFVDALDRVDSISSGLQIIAPKAVPEAARTYVDKLGDLYMAHGDDSPRGRELWSLLDGLTRTTVDAMRADLGVK